MRHSVCRYDLRRRVVLIWRWRYWRGYCPVQSGRPPQRSFERCRRTLRLPGFRIGTTRPVRLFGYAAICSGRSPGPRTQFPARRLVMRRRRAGARSGCLAGRGVVGLWGVNCRIGRICGTSAISMFPRAIVRPALERSNFCFYSAPWGSPERLLSMVARERRRQSGKICRTAHLQLDLRHHHLY